MRSPQDVLLLALQQIWGTAKFFEDLAREIWPGGNHQSERITEEDQGRFSFVTSGGRPTDSLAYIPEGGMSPCRQFLILHWVELTPDSPRFNDLGEPTSIRRLYLATPKSIEVKGEKHADLVVAEQDFTVVTARHIDGETQFRIVERTVSVEGVLAADLGDADAEAVYAGLEHRLHMLRNRRHDLADQTGRIWERVARLTMPWLNRR